MEKEKAIWGICHECQGRGQKIRKISKKLRLSYQAASERFEKRKGEGIIPVRPKGHVSICLNCKGSGLIRTSSHQSLDKENKPQLVLHHLYHLQ